MADADTFEETALKVLDDILQALRIIQGLLAAPTQPQQMTSTVGWRCGYCGGWVPNGTTHHCSWAPPSPLTYGTTCEAS